MCLEGCECVLMEGGRGVLRGGNAEWPRSGRVSASGMVGPGRTQTFW